MGGRDSGRGRQYSKEIPPIENHVAESHLLDLEVRCLNFLDKLIEVHGNDNATGMRADIPAKVAKQLKRRKF